MNQEALDAIESDLSQVLRRRPDVVWPDDLIVVGEDEFEERPEGAAIEEALFDKHEDDAEALDESPNQIYRIEPLLEDIVRSPWPPHQPDLWNELLEIHGTLRERFGEGYPGAPGGADAGTVGVGGVVASGSPPPPPLTPDVLAFYLPWHYFSSSLWGIYLIVEGVQFLGDAICRAALGYLSLREARRVAKIFLFHHEAYHNAVESFASRLEVSHRAPCYIAGFQPIWKNGFSGGILHEEGLATAYAAEKVRTTAFEDIYLPGKTRTLKRKISHAAILKFIGRMPSAYRSALLMTTSQMHRDAQNLFLEENRNSCFPPTPPQTALLPKIWEASPHAMRPSLQRNKAYSYVVRRSNPLVRRALLVPHFKRTEFVAQLNARVGGSEIPQGSGKHPKWKSSGGKTVPVPGHRELGRGLCRAILRQLGVDMGVTEFMSRTGTVKSEYRQAP